MDTCLRSNSSIGKKAVRGIFATTIGQICKFTLQIATTAILARILIPEDFGLYGMALVVINFAQMTQDLGLTMAVVQRKKISHSEISNLFWLNLCLVAVVGSIILISSGPLSVFYARSEIRGLVAFLGIAVIFGGVSSLFRALLRRSFRFKTIVGVDLTSSFLASLCGIFAAYLGAGYWSFGIQAVVSSILGLFGYSIVCGFKPAAINWETAIRGYLHYGLNHAGFKIVNYFSRNGDNLIIGKFSTPEILGFYVNAYKLVMLPLQQMTAPINQALLPALSRLQDQPKRFEVAYDRSLGILCCITIPIVLMMTANAYEIVELILGPGWDDSATLFICLAPAALVGATNMGTGWVYLALGHTERQFRWSLIHSTVTVAAMLMGFYFGGVYGLALGISAVFLVIRVPGVLYCFRGTVVSLPNFIKPHLLPFSAGLFAMIGAFLVKSICPNSLKLLIGIVTFIGIYLSYIFSFPRGRYLAYELRKMLVKKNKN